MNLSHYLASTRAPTHIPEAGREDLARLLRDRGSLRGVEIGTAEGAFAETLCRTIPGLMLYCVDPYTPYPGYNGMRGLDLSDCYERARTRLSEYQTIFIRSFSAEAAPGFEDESLDFVYIDANHELPWIMNDLCTWSAKVRAGGIVAGHDYHSQNRACHVEYALDCFTRAFDIRPWFVLGDRYHSWFYVKGRP